MIVPPRSEAIDFNSDTQQLKNSQIITDQAVGHPGLIELNASITNVQRNITIKASSLIEFEDQITLQIHDNLTTISTLNYTLPTVFDKYAQEVEIWSQPDTAVAIDQDKNSKSFSKYAGIDATTYFIDIRENNTAISDEIESLHITVRMKLIDAIQWDIANQVQVGKFIAPVFPKFSNLPVKNGAMGAVLEQDLDTFLTENMTKISYANAEWPARRDASGNILEWRNFTATPFDELEGFTENFDYTEIVFTSDSVTRDSLQVTVPYVYSSAKRHLKVDPWGLIYVTEELTVLHTGGSRLEETGATNLGYELKNLKINVPRNALITKVQDELGILNSNLRDSDTLYPDTTIDTSTGKQSLDVILRNSIYGGETYSLTLKYQFNGSNLLTTSGSNYKLNSTLLSDYETSVYHLESTYELPAGASLKKHSYLSKSQNSDLKVDTQVKRDTLSFLRHIELKFTVTNASFVDNYEFQIEFTYYGLGHFQYVITFMIITAVLMSIFVALNNVEYGGSAPIDKTRESVPSTEIDAFFNTFTERSGATKRISELRGKRKKGKITKKEFDGQIKAIQRRIRELNPLLDEASKNLSNAGARYQRLVDKIMLSSQKQQDIKTNADNARKSYLKGNNPKDIYQKLIRDYTKDSKKLESTINKSLTELLEIDQEY